MSTNAIPIHPDDHGSIEVGDAEVVFRDFVERDPDVFEILAEADDLQRTAHACLQIGARAMKVSNATVDHSVVERGFTEMTGRFERGLENTLKEISATADGLLSEDGTLSSALGEWQAEVGRLLGDTFDPDSKKSVISKIETLLEDTRENHARAIRRLIDPDDESSPLGAWRRDIIEKVEDRAERTDQRLREIMERIAANEAATEMFDRTSLKGATFETLVHHDVEQIARCHGDSVEPTGTTKGSDGNDVGDMVVTLTRDDTGGTAGRFVLEMKDTKLTPRDITRELDAAASNRDAQVAILVFADQGQAPTSIPFSYSDDRAILVYDKTDPDDRLLQVAYMWARWRVRRAIGDASDGEVDRDAILALIDRIAKAVGRAVTIKRHHTIAMNHIGKAGNETGALEGDIEKALEELRDRLS